MKRLLAAAWAVGLLLHAAAATAHRIDEYLQATILSVGTGEVRASMRLVPGEVVAPLIVAAIDTDRDGAISSAEQLAYAKRVLADVSISVDGDSALPALMTWSFPTPDEMRQGVGEVRLEYRVTLPTVPGEHTLAISNRHEAARSVYLMNVLASDDARIRIDDQKRSTRQSLYELSFHQAPDGIDGSSPPPGTTTGGWQRLEFAKLFGLGMRHIAEGTDHLLFLLTLLLPAPLLASGTRWGTPLPARRSLARVLGIVTAFTVGHSATLLLASVGGWSLAPRPVEVLIALSILASAFHALRPVFPGKEAAIAAAFGLVHGLAFASTLDLLGFDPGARLLGTLAFNLGIEAMQLVVIAAVLPSLLLVSRTRAYDAVRVAGGVVAAAASSMWMAERLLDVDMRVDSAFDALAGHAQGLAVLFLMLALLCYWRQAVRDVEGPAPDGPLVPAADAPCRPVGRPAVGIRAIMSPRERPGPARRRSRSG